MTREKKITALFFAIVAASGILWAIVPLGALVACVFGVLLGAPTLKLRGIYRVLFVVPWAIPVSPPIARSRRSRPSGGTCSC
jgi:ABC-type branched-subunit amino acid transport system permease subunit